MCFFLLKLFDLIPKGCFQKVLEDPSSNRSDVEQLANLLFAPTPFEKPLD